MRSALIILFLGWFSLSPAQQPPAVIGGHAPAAQATPRLSPEDVQAMRQDLDHMKALLRQMESNLAFVDTTQSPLKHQFQLEIDMWQTMIAQMERRLSAHSH